MSRLPGTSDTGEIYLCRVSRHIGERVPQDPGTGVGRGGGRERSQVWRSITVGADVQMERGRSARVILLLANQIRSQEALRLA